MWAIGAIDDRQSPSSVHACLAALALAAIALPAFANPADTPQVEVSTATLPRFDATDSATRSSRLGITLLPERRSGVGLAFGVTSLSGSGAAFAPPGVAVPSMDLGIHWRYTFDSHYRFDVTAYRRVPNSDAMSMIESHDPSYGARVEMGLSSMGNTRAKGFVADRGFLGFQLESGARVTIKRSGGKPMIYYRNTF